MTGLQGSCPPGAERPEVVTDMRVAQVVTDRRHLRRLAPFMGREITVGEAAQALGLGVTATYKLAVRFLALGLIRETRQEQRPGRALRYYRAPAAFFVPFSLLGLEQIGQHNRRAHLDRFERGLALTLRHELSGEWGALTSILPSGEAYYEVATLDGQMLDPAQDGSPIVLSGWNLVNLTPAEARSLQRALLDALLPYVSREDRGGSGKPYLTGVFLCPDPPGAQA